MGGDVAQYLARAWLRFREIEICNYFSYKIMLGVLLILYVLFIGVLFLSRCSHYLLQSIYVANTNQVGVQLITLKKYFM
jgi:hypothetical protein